MNSSLIKKIIFDYFDGKHSSIQYKMIEEWLKTGGNQELFYQYLNEWESQHPQYIFDVEIGSLKIKEKIALAKVEEANSFIDEQEIPFRVNYKWLAAAAFVLISSWIGFSQLTKTNTISYEKLVKQTKNMTGEIYEKVNLTQESMLVNLPDESIVILQPKSKISYSPKEYNLHKREVILSGEAFFEVQKDVKSPFIVYANEMITKVLGTSFTIKALPKSAETEVIVKTGKVAVFMQTDVDKEAKINGNALTGLVLSANEKVKINRNDFIIEKPMMVDQEQLSMPIQKLKFDFDETPTSEVFDILKTAYNVQIIFDKEKLSNCKLTAHLSDEPLMEKIKLICIAIEANYEEKDNKITIKSDGCK